MADTYQVIGPPAFNPLIANKHDGVSNLTGIQEASLAPGDNARGEPPVIGLTNGLRHAMNRRVISADDGTKIIAISLAIGGKTIEQLSKTSPQGCVDRYGILLDGVTLAHSLAGGDHVVPIVSWIQGEYNYVNTHGGVRNQAGYKAMMNELFDNLSDDIQEITDQPLPPLFMTYQTGAAYTRDADDTNSPGLHRNGAT